MTTSNPKSSINQTMLITIAVAMVALLWAYWSSFVAMADKWANNPQYSHGYLVPVFAAVLLWLRRAQVRWDQLQPSWWGLGLIAFGAVMRLAAKHFYLGWFDGLSLLPMVGGVALLAGGWKMLQWSAASIGFLFFMVPLPFRLEYLMGPFLQRIAAISSTYLLQTVGLPAIREGNVIALNEIRLGVVEACSGLRMLFIFFAVSCAVMLLSQRSRWQKMVILLSALPIALFTNILRITVTGVLHVTVGSELANFVFHDFAGWLMMPIALVLLGIELQFLSRLFLEETSRRPVALGTVLPRGRHASQTVKPV